MASEIFTRSLFKSKRTPPKPVVLDLGSHSVKAGFAYEKAFHPTRTFINCISSDVHNKVGKDCTCCSLSLTHSHSINDWPYCEIPLWREKATPTICTVVTRQGRKIRMCETWDQKADDLHGRLLCAHLCGSRVCCGHCRGRSDTFTGAK